MQSAKVNNVVKIVLMRISNIKLKRKISNKNNIKWCVITDIKINENRSGESLSLIFTVWYS